MDLQRFFDVSPAILTLRIEHCGALVTQTRNASPIVNRPSTREFAELVLYPTVMSLLEKHSTVTGAAFTFMRVTFETHDDILVPLPHGFLCATVASGAPSALSEALIDVALSAGLGSNRLGALAEDALVVGS